MGNDNVLVVPGAHHQALIVTAPILPIRRKEHHVLLQVSAVAQGDYGQDEKSTFDKALQYIQQVDVCASPCSLTPLMQVTTTPFYPDLSWSAARFI